MARRLDGSASTSGRLGAIHGLRIALKQARYAAELAAPKARPAGVHRPCTDAPALLGEHHDAVVAERRLRSTTVVDARTAAAFVAGRMAERQVAQAEPPARAAPAGMEAPPARRRATD